MPILPNKSGESIDEDSGEIVKSKLLLVEGKDETIFFEACFKKIHNLNVKLDEVQIIQTGGVDKFKTELPALINRTGFSENVESIAIIRDADQSFESALQSVCDLLELHGLPYPSEHSTYKVASNLKVGIFIMPGSSEEGTMLEDLCLRTQSENPIMGSVEAYFESLENKDVEMPRNLSKAKVQVFLAGMPKIVNSLGIGALRGYWDLEHDCLSGLKNFLEEL